MEDLPVCVVCEEHEGQLFRDPVLDIVVCGKECQHAAHIDAVDIFRITHIGYMKQWTVYLAKSMERPVEFAAPPRFLDAWVKLLPTAEARAQWRGITREYKRYLVGMSANDYPSMDPAIDSFMRFVKGQLKMDASKAEQVRRGIVAHSTALRAYRRYLAKGGKPSKRAMHAEVRKAVGVAGRIGEIMNKTK